MKSWILSFFLIASLPILKAQEKVEIENDVLLESIGIETVGGVFTEIVKKEQKQPLDIVKTFSTYADNQDQITLNFFAGNDPLAQNNRFLGKYRIEGIPEGPRDDPMIEVHFLVEDERFQLEARDQKSGANLKVRKVEQLKDRRALER